MTEGPAGRIYTTSISPERQRRTGFRVTRGEEFIPEDMALSRTLYDPARVDALHLKLEDYTRRVQESVHPQVVRDGIFKLAIVDILLSEGAVEYFDAYDYGMTGIEGYGVDILIEGSKEMRQTFDDFDSAYRVIKNYLETGNQQVEGGAGVVEL